MSDDMSHDANANNVHDVLAAAPSDADVPDHGQSASAHATDNAMNANTQAHAADTSARGPYLVLTAICDASARPAAVTLGHGDAMERALNAVNQHDTVGIDLVELPIAPAAFAALRKHLGFAESTVTVYDLFPLSAKLEERYRKIAGQFLAAEALWTLEEQGLLSGVPFTVNFDLPRGWDKDPKKLHARLVDEHALELTENAVQVFKEIKTAWNSTAPAS